VLRGSAPPQASPRLLSLFPATPSELFAMLGHDKVRPVGISAGDTESVVVSVRI
jgi:hypothetical protein